MALDFNALRKSSGGFDKLMKEVEKIAQPQSQDNSKDDRFWSPEVDKAGNGYAVIRFLPPPKGEELPWVRIWNHGFQGPTGKWYIENSLTTIGQADPVSELNTQLWNTGNEADKETVRKQKRRLTYISNIMVVKDPAHPENEGKVFLYKFGKKIFDKIKDVMQPQFEDEDPVNPFDFWTGANFKLKIRNVEGYRNYDKSEFDSPSKLADDSELESIWGKQYSLNEFLDPKHFKSYNELKAKLEQVLNASGNTARADKVELSEEAPRQAFKPKAESAPWDDDTPPKGERSKATKVADDDDSLSYFAQLANDD